MHTSARTGVEAIAESRNRGFPIYGETLHHYALLTSEAYGLPNGQIYHTYPSLKSGDDRAALWEGMSRTGAISTIATGIPITLIIRPATPIGTRATISTPHRKD